MTARTTTAPDACEIVAVGRRLTAVVRIHALMSELMQAQKASRATIAAALPALDVGAVGAGITLWRPPTDGRLYMEPGVLVERSFAPAGEVVPSELPAGRAAHLLLRGSYAGLAQAWNTLLGWCTREKLALAGTNWEIYEPPSGDEATQETRLYALLA